MAAVPGEKMQVTVQFPAEFANLPVVVQSLDGADVSYDGSAVGADGTVQFAVTTASQPGLYRVAVLADTTTSALLQFWVVSPTGYNPPLLFPGDVQ